MTTEADDGRVPAPPGDDDEDGRLDGESDLDAATRIAERDGENRWCVLHERFGVSRDDIRADYLDPYDPEPDPELLEFLNDVVGCTNEELGLDRDGAPEDD